MQMAERREPGSHVSLPVVEAHPQRVSYLIQIPPRVMRQGVPFAVRQCPQARPQLVPPRPDRP